MSAPLHGIGVVVTRPAHQAEPLVRALEGAGAEVWRLPTLAIVAEPVDAAIQRAAQRAAGADWLIFVSSNAVVHGLPLIQAAGGPSPGARCAAVGRATAEALCRGGVNEVCSPEHGATSEDLLAETPLGKISGGRAAIVRGRGGRPYLAEVLRKRGVEVDFLEVYRRERTAVDPRPLLNAAAEGRVQVAVVTSGEVLDHLLERLGARGKQWLASAGMVVIGERVAALAAPYARRVEVAATAAEDEIIEAAARAAAAVAETRSR